MTRVLLATDSVHATAAGCDYLADRIGPDDEVIALTVLESAIPDHERDAADALNVATVRLRTVETIRREGDPAPAILEAASEHDADDIVLVAAETGVGSTIRSVLAGADRPVVVVPAA